ncbi:MAG: glycosyltransferase, partial [Nitrospirota bacterium]
ELGIKENGLVVIHVANLKPVKGHRFLLHDFAEIIRQAPDMKLLLIGKDELNGSLHRLAAQLDIADNVLFLGTRQDVPDLLSAADICVLPSLSEGMSNAILEYMAAGKPVVATNVGGNPELIKNGFNGFLVAGENVEELKNALLALIKDGGKRQAMGANGFMRVKQEFSMEKMVRKYEELFNPGSLP